MYFKRIRDLREDNDKSQKELAEYLKISQQYYSQYERGNYTMPIQLLIELSKFYSVSIDYIVGLSNKKDI